jgi:glycosyltransferase involved in cell wall biosynthesis
MKALLVSFYFPPAGGGGVQRPLKLASHLPEFGIEVHVLAPDDSKWIHCDEELQAPANAVIHRARYIGPRGRLPAEELHGLRGASRLRRQVALTPRRFVIPDENAPWALTATREAVRIVREHDIDVVITTSPPNSIHLIGGMVKQRTGVHWVADLRDSLTSKSDRQIERMSVRAKERAQVWVAALVAARADGVVGATDSIAEELRRLNPGLRTAVVPNGADYEDFDGLEYSPGERFRITHTGSFFGKRDPRPFLQALEACDDSVLARFVGEFRRSDREWVEGLGLEDRLELHPFLPHRQTLELQRNSEALLLLLPEIGERGRDVPSGKLFEYLAAQRPILAIVPPDGAAADLVRETGAGTVVAPDDVDGIGAAIDELVRRWRSGTLDGPMLNEDVRVRIDRRTRSAEFAAFLHELV